MEEQIHCYFLLMFVPVLVKECVLKVVLRDVDCVNCGQLLNNSFVGPKSFSVEDRTCFSDGINGTENILFNGSVWVSVFLLSFFIK